MKKSIFKDLAKSKMFRIESIMQHISWYSFEKNYGHKCNISLVSFLHEQMGHVWAVRYREILHKSTFSSKHEVAGQDSVI